MSNYNSIMKGLSEAIEYEQGKSGSAKSDKVNISKLPEISGNEIKKIRLSCHLTQQSFSAVLGVSKKTIEAWESGKNIPSGPAQRLLEMLKNDASIIEKNGIVSWDKKAV